MISKSNNLTFFFKKKNSNFSVIHNQSPMVTLCNRQNLNNFEIKAGRKPGMNGQPQSGNSGGGISSGGNSGSSGLGSQQQQQQQQSNSHHHQNNFMMQNNRNYNQQNSNQMHQQSSHRPPLIPRPMRPNAPLLSHHSNTGGGSVGGGHSQPRLSMPHPTLSFGNTGGGIVGGGGSNQSGNHHHQSSWNNHLMSNGPRNNPLQSANANQLNPLLRLNQGNHRSLTNQPLLNAPSNQSSLDLRSQLSSGESNCFYPIAY